MSAEAILSRLEKVKKTGRDSWLACCPAHDDKRPSMTIREVEDGRVLVHCFAGCSATEIISSVGLEFDALFPPRPAVDSLPAVRRPYPAADVLEAFQTETLVVVTSAAKIRSGEGLNADEMKRLVLAASRIEEGRRLANG